MFYYLSIAKNDTMINCLVICLFKYLINNRIVNIIMRIKNITIIIFSVTRFSIFICDKIGQSNPMDNKRPYKM